MAEVCSVMENLIRSFQVPDVDKLRHGDLHEVGKLLANRGVILHCSAMDLEGTEPAIHAEAVYTMNQLRKLALTSTPCLRGLMREAAAGHRSPKHDEMVDCAVTYYGQVRAVIEEACEQFSPDLWDYCKLKFDNN